MAEKHRFRVYIDFISERDATQLETYLTRAVEKAGAQVNYVSLKQSTSIGRPPIAKPRIEELIVQGGSGWEGIPEEVAESLKLKLPSVRRAMKQLADEGKLVRVYQNGEVVYSVPQ
jgi:hypothetical protein